MRRSVVTLAVVALMAIGTTAVLWRHARAPGKARLEDDRGASEDVADQVAALRREVARLQAKEPLRIDLGALRSAGNAPVEPAAPPIPDPEVVAAEQRKRALELGTRLGRMLAREPADAPAADRVAQQVRGTVEEVAGTAIARTECGGSFCRVILSNQDPAAHSRIAALISAQTPGDAEVLFQRDLEATPPTTTLYVFKKGHTLRDVVADGS